VGDEPGLSATVRRTGPATAGPGGIANTGVMYLNDRPVARSVYLKQVQQIFPFQLVGRDDELAELTTFCTKLDSGSYVWWQGPVWAGKSALMAWFVLHPPAGVRVVSFFITARFAEQSDRKAFLEVVLEQLAEVAGQPMPDALTESNQQAWFGQLLEDAAAACKENEQRLVLVVDGLDEDQGVTASSDAHSIAALLPAAPPAGMRIIVAGRPDPSVPKDVPQWHPLRDKKIVRSLCTSPYAQMVRDDAERELGHLLDDQGSGRTLLGLVTVARGGLSTDDLAELSGESPWTVDRTLQSVLGRTFHGRLNRWRVSAPPVFVLAHEELQQTAAKSLSRDELARHLSQLHSWAEEYRQRGWPPETPEYLLRGYHRLLLTTDDVERMTTLATDRTRLDRMLDVSGGDAAAFAEITAVQEHICSQDHPDLTAMLRLAIARDELIKRNSHIPETLPAAWVKLGNLNRAETLARSITDPSGQARALTEVAKALARAGDLNNTRQVAQQAEAAAYSIINPSGPSGQARALAAVAVALAGAGDLDRAEALARSITGSDGQVYALAAVAEALAEAGDLERARQVAAQAEATASSLTLPDDQSWALAAVAEALAGTGDLDRAEAAARSTTYPDHQVRALAAVAAALAEAGDLEKAHQVAAQAEATARSLTLPDDQAQALGVVAWALASTGDLDEAKAAARSITGSDGQVYALAGMAVVLAGAGDLEKARQVAVQAEAAARSITKPDDQAQALTLVAWALAEAGDLEKARQVAVQAEAAARSIADPSGQARALAAVA
jgi:tetratricopeptide (TPR) repeat protein